MKSSFPLVPAVLVAALLVCPGASPAQERELTREHDGSLGAFAALGVEYTSLVIAQCFGCTGSSYENGVYHLADSISGPDLVLDLGGTLAVGQPGGEFVLRGRFVSLSRAKGVSAFLGYRKYWGKDDFKTFIAIDLMANFMPTVTFGARPGFGVAWDFSSIMGLWAEAGGTLGIGWGYRFGLELTVGFQARSYLL